LCYVSPALRQVVTVLFSIAMFYLFGPLWGMGVIALLLGIDALTFYWNW